MADFHERDITGGPPSLDESAGAAPGDGEREEAPHDGTEGDPPEDGTDEAEGADADEPDDGHGGDDRHQHDHGHGHGHHAHDLETVRAAVVTVSSTRSLNDDPGGDAVVEAFEAEGHDIVTRELVADDLDGIQGRLDSLVRRDDVDVVVTTGGTGVTPDDVTVEATRPLLEKELPGFGELFRRRSEADIGTRVVATRAIAGIADGVPVFCLPGSETAALLGARDIIVAEVGHLAGLARRDEDEEE